uniref:Sodium/calcium exchanger membrane region domain-containing protein n=1 Tax=Oryzias sinensis TaxID=183150 RepID=A0A8C8E279_9TELE
GYLKEPVKTQGNLSSVGYKCSALHHPRLILNAALLRHCFDKRNTPNSNFTSSVLPDGHGKSPASESPGIHDANFQNFHTKLPDDSSTMTAPTVSPDDVPHFNRYPADLFSVEQHRKRWVILHFLGIMYMFVSLIIICDEFFVPAVGLIMEKLAVSDDVAGATFMAAGRSFPSVLFILVTVFVHRQQIYRIVFVTGMCAALSRTVVRLSWWPLFRDLSFYLLYLILVGSFSWTITIVGFYWHVPVILLKKYRRFYAVTFLVSLIWICVFSYFTHWWTYQIGETAEGLQFMGILILMICSPDLITSVIVTRKGLGNMAVSSSIGSSIFSTSVSLPLLMLLYSLSHGFAPAGVSSKGIFCSMMLLILMLVLAIISIISCKWKMNKALGASLVLLHIIFVVISILFVLGIIVCPLF